MRSRLILRFTAACTIVIALVTVLAAAPEGQRVWFKFNKAFISARYDNGEASGMMIELDSTYFDFEDGADRQTGCLLC
jgi:hypothetical protein